MAGHNKVFGICENKCLVEVLPKAEAATKDNLNAKVSKIMAHKITESEVDGESGEDYILNYSDIDRGADYVFINKSDGSINLKLKNTSSSYSRMLIIEYAFVTDNATQKQCKTMISWSRSEDLVLGNIPVDSVLMIKFLHVETYE